jgi:hypothetical protein
MPQLLVTANDGSRSPVLFTLMVEAICSSETLVLTRAMRFHIPEDGSCPLPTSNLELIQSPVQWVLECSLSRVAAARA